MFRQSYLAVIRDWVFYQANPVCDCLPTAPGYKRMHTESIGLYSNTILQEKPSTALMNSQKKVDEGVNPYNILF
jgi:hypothetical protein